MAEYPTSIRLTIGDKKRLRKHAARWQLSLAGLIQMVLLQWLEVQDKPSAKGAVELDKSTES